MKLKKLAATVLAGIMVFSMAACGDAGQESSGQNESEQNSSEQSESDQSEPEQTAKEDKITIMVPPVTSTYVEDLQGWIEEYRVDHPNITVEVIATSWDEHTNKLTTMAQAQEAPDIAEVSYGAIGTYVDSSITRFSPFRSAAS